MSGGCERVRVIARVRPFTPADPDDADLSTIIVNPTHVSVEGKFVYAVDHVYPMEAETDEIFGDVVKPLLDDFLSGFNITLMAYGQTGTGKTYTMDRITPLAISCIVLDGFRGSIEDLSFQYIEVYGDNIRDLLSDDPTESTKNLQLFDEGGGTILTGATRISARSLRQVIEVVEHGSRMRSTGSTHMNDSSSRSHGIFTIFNHRDKSKFHLVDLAGSERVNKTQNVGKRLQESIGINTGLLALGNVIRALKRNHSAQGPRHHIPYRSSKLTRILQDSLGGNSKTVFIACIAPDSYNKGETKRTLEYCTLAQRVLNTPVANYNDLYEEQCGGRGAASDEYAAHSVGGKEPTVPQQMFDEVMAEKDRLEAELNSLRHSGRRSGNRISVLEEELQKDEVIFRRQLIEIQRLSEDNEKLRRRVAFLEGAQPSLRHETEGQSVVSKVMRMNGFAVDAPSAPLPPAAAQRDAITLSSFAEEERAVRSTGAAAADLAMKALNYQVKNSQLKGQMTALESQLDEKQREASLLRLELQQMRLQTPRSARATSFYT